MLTKAIKTERSSGDAGLDALKTQTQQNDIRVSNHTHDTPTRLQKKRRGKCETRKEHNTHATLHTNPDDTLYISYYHSTEQYEIEMMYTDRDVNRIEWMRERQYDAELTYSIKDTEPNQICTERGESDGIRDETEWMDGTGWELSTSLLK
jgi:hypothetical protein